MKFSRTAISILAASFFVLALPTIQHATLAAQQPASADDLQSKAPAVVFIIRHAEKPMDDKDPNLAPQGYKRANALPALFLPTPGSSNLPRFPRPNVLFASDPSKHSNRPIETITPLAAALHQTIHHEYTDLEFSALANQVLSGKYAGKVVLICWHHGEIPHLAKALGATETPKHWDDTVFDQVWMLECVNGKAQFSILPERLLPGDAVR